MLVVLIRAVIGPTVIDRLVAINVVGTKAAVILVLMGFIFERADMFVDIAIGYGLLNYIASIAAAKYFQNHGADHPEQQWEGETNAK
jgi:multicomponent Na+:H+ antiporter subunit F